MFENKLYILMYHYVRDLKHSRYSKIKGLDYKMFKEQIKFLKQNFNIITMEQVIDSVEKNKQLPDKALILTFDDGYIDHYTNVFPVLKKEKVQGSFFIPGRTFIEHKLLDVNKIHFILATADIKRILEDVFCQMNYYRGIEFDYPSNEELFRQYAIASRFDKKEVVFIKKVLQTVLPEKVRIDITSILFQKYVGVNEETFARELYMTREEIGLMKNEGMFIGVHGYDHYWQGELNSEKMESDILKGLDALSEFINRDAWVMNYPYGNYNDEVINVVSKNGCKLGLTTEVGIADLCKYSKYLLPRFDTNDFPPKSNNYQNIKGALSCVK